METAPIRVLLVDDHRIMLWAMSQLIETAAPRMQVCATATTVEQALQAVAEGAQPDVMLLDLDLGGHCASQELARLHAASAAKILIFTGVTDEARRDRAMLAGARGILAKSVPAETVLRAIQKVHEGEIWLDRNSMGRITQRLSGARAAAAAERPLLTPREWHIARAVCSAPGRPARATAQLLGISENTLNNHLASIYSKLGVANRLELFNYMNKIEPESDKQVLR